MSDRVKRPGVVIVETSVAEWLDPIRHAVEAKVPLTVNVWHVRNAGPDRWLVTAPSSEYCRVRAIVRDVVEGMAVGT